VRVEGVLRCSATHCHQLWWQRPLDSPKMTKPASMCVPRDGSAATPKKGMSTDPVAGRLPLLIQPGRSMRGGRARGARRAARGGQGCRHPYRCRRPRLRSSKSPSWNVWRTAPGDWSCRVASMRWRLCPSVVLPPRSGSTRRWKMGRLQGGHTQGGEEGEGDRRSKSHREEVRRFVRVHRPW
jgi:hypothetical protein